MSEILPLANFAISGASVIVMAGGMIYLLVVYRRSMRQYKQQMDQTVIEMRRQNDALEALIADHDRRLKQLGA